MRLLLVLWITIRNAFEAAVWATLFWTASEAFFDVEWIHLFLIFFAILFIGGLGTMGAEPWPMLGIDPMLVGLAIVQATTNALVLAVITIVVASYDTEKQAMDAAVAWMRHGKSPNPVEDVGTDTATEKQPEADRLQTERDLIEAIDLGARKINKRTADFVPEGEKKSDLLIKMYLEYLCFFVHVTNRLASKVASYKEVDKMYNTLVPLAVAHVLCEVFRSANEAARQEFAKAIPELIEAREKQYAQSKEYASKEWKPLSGTSTVDTLVRNISETLDTHNPEVLFQIQLAARESMQEAKIPELIANYRKAHCAEVPRKIE